MTEQKKIVVIHGPNLNMLGRREPEVYGTATLDDVNKMLARRAVELGLVVAAFQSNHEGELVDTIQAAADTCSGMIINPAAYTHTSVAIRDALMLLDLPVIEVVESPDDTPNIGFTGDGTAINSGEFSGLSTPEFKQKITEKLAADGVGTKAVNYRLRDWLFSRQRYWGEPFPIWHEVDQEGHLTQAHAEDAGSGVGSCAGDARAG